eukprot:Tbor_TRINITY_DN1996_c0_g1::TRINITY_DN1996_c0_g1_i1::g.3533::m.3533/K00939/adk, AK; adenylate kinase
MKRVFISEVDTPLGTDIAALFKKTTEYEVFGTVRNTADEFAFISNQKPLPTNITKIVPSYRTGSKAFRVNLLSSDVIICLVRDDIMEAEAASKMLRNHPFEVEKTLVLVTSVLSWANTIKGRRAKELKIKEKEREQRIADGEDPIDVDIELGFAINGETADEEADVEAEDPVVVLESEYAERIPHEAYQHFLDIERFVKQANSETLHSHVVFAGLQYGVGEEALRNAFMAAWHQRPVPMYSRGNNVVPMIHRTDLALLLFKIGSSYDIIEHRYILAVDSGNCTLGSVSDTIAKKLGNGVCTIPFLSDASRTSVPVSKYGLVKAINGDNVSSGDNTGASMKQVLPYYKNFFELDLHMEGSAAVDILPEEEWVAYDGFIESFDRVAKEFKEIHSLSPVRVMVIGPPRCGKSTIAKDISSTYRVPHLTIESIIKAYKDNLSVLLLEQKHHRRKIRQAQLRAEEENKTHEIADDAEDKMEREEDEEHDEHRDDDKDDMDVVSDIEYDNDGSHIPAEIDDSVNSPTTHHGADDEDENIEEHIDKNADMNDEEVEENEELIEEDDPDDEVASHLTETIERARQVLSLQIREGRKLQDNEDNEDEEEKELDEGEVPVCDRPLPPGARLRYVDEALAAMARWRLQQSDCQNQGYVLDGFPKNTTQSHLTFRVNEDDVDQKSTAPAFSECAIPTLADVTDREINSTDAVPLLEPEEINSSVDDRLTPDTAICLTATDTLLTSRIDSENSHTSMATLLSRIKLYRATHDPTKLSAESLISWVKTIKTSPILSSGRPSSDEGTSTIPLQINYLEVSAGGLTTPEGYELGMSSIFTLVGPRHYRCPTVQEIKQQEANAANDSALSVFKAQRSEEERVKEEEAVRIRKEREKVIHERRYRSIADEKEQAKMINAMPMDIYLSSLVLPSITKGVSLVAEIRPNDPINSLADFLFEYKPRKDL